MRKLKFDVVATLIIITFNVLITTGILAQVPAFDNDKPTNGFETIYSQNFNTTSGWDNTKFYSQWTSLNEASFSYNDILSNYLQFVFPTKFLICSNTYYTAPYIFESKIEYGNNQNQGGVIIRYQPSLPNWNLWELQDPKFDIIGNQLNGFNSAGIALYPADATNFIVQFSGQTTTTANPNTNYTPRTQITVAAPVGITNFLNGANTLRVEDYGASIYVYFNGTPFIRINLNGLSGSIYSSGTVYDKNMEVQGTFTNKVVPVVGKVAIAQRIASLRLYNAVLKTSNNASSPLWDERPVVNYNNQYSQTFNSADTWDKEMFYTQWDFLSDSIRTTDIKSDYLQFVFPTKFLICSKKPYITPYVFESKIDFANERNQGGIILRYKPTSDLWKLWELQDPKYDVNGVQIDGFNSAGIAIYPADATRFIVQFSGKTSPAKVYNTFYTPRTQISVPAPEGVTSLLNGAYTLRVEDTGSSIYVFFNDLPYIRINLTGFNGSMYTSGTVYDNKMNPLGSFTDAVLPKTGKVAIAERLAALRLLSTTIRYNEGLNQTIEFNLPVKKLITESPLTISATASSGLPVQFEVVSGPATIDGDKLTLSGTGIVIISASQSGNNQYYPANDVVHGFYVSDPAIMNAAPTSQDYVDNWVVTDALGRKLPTFEDVGGKRANKQVGMFYYLWLGTHYDKVLDVSKIIDCYPSDPLSSNNPCWSSFSGANYFWGEPEAGYHRSEDPWVIRRDLQMLSNAHIDFLFFDTSNGFLYLDVVKILCEVSLQMRKEGIHTPQIAFLTNAGTQTVNTLYDNFYAYSAYDELWFKWEDKPLILGNINEPALRPEVKNFFTWRYSWAWTDQSIPRQWQWIDLYPQDYGWNTDPAIPEQMPVAVGSHSALNIGTSFNKYAQPKVNEKYLTEFTGQGLNFAEQWEKALEVDPSIVMVTQWNEWIAGRSIWDKGDAICAGRPIKNGDSYFIDAFNEEFNRDIVPMKGGHTDNYYYQLIANVRKYKGMSAPQVFSNPTTINIAGDFSQWQSITPVFKDPPGDIVHRNFRGYDAAVQYVNNTGRNDILESKATYDDNNIFFYVKTSQSITAYTDPNWMLLFIDVDRNKQTGWEGYDFVVNRDVKSTSETTLKQWDGKAWVNESSITYKLVDNEMVLSIPRTALLMDKTTPEFYFKWADNPQNINDITAFFTDGDVAPDRRFNFNFSTTKIAETPQTPFKTIKIPGTIEFEDFDNGGAGVAYADATFGNSGGAYRPNESVDIIEKSANEYCINSINKGEWLKYTLDINSIGVFSVEIKYASNDSAQVVMYVDDVDKSEIIRLPSSGGLSTWTSKMLDLRLTAGKHILKFFIKNASMDLSLDKIVITEKNVMLPGNGTGLNKSIWVGSAGGRAWFTDSICSEIDAEINENWADVSPGCGVSKDFWNIRWSGQIQALFSETYTFYLTANDMGRAWINDQLVADGWNATSSGKTIEASVDLTAGQKVPIKVDFAEKLGNAAIKFEWSSASTPKEVVPVYQLYPVSEPNGLRKTDYFNISLFPNPATNKLTITGSQRIINCIKIVDLQGRVVYFNNEKFKGKKIIDLDLDRGVYFVNLYGDATFATQKLLIEK